MYKKLSAVRKRYHNITQTDKIIILIAIIGIIIRMIYIIYTPYYLRQHDSSELGWKEGHLAYIVYWYYNFKLPDFDPRSIWQFYHPPLHHIIASLWMKLNVSLGFQFKAAVENIQVLITIYSCITSYLCYKIFKELGIKGKGLIVAFAIVCLHPTLILMSGSINNDMLCILFQTAAILATIKWYRHSSTWRIFWIAIFLGLSMMVKTSGALIAPGIAFVFLYTFFKNRKSKRKLGSLITQYITFLIISVPLGMWWSIYANVRFGMPYGYVPKLSNNLDQYLGNYSVSSRFLDFNLIQVKNVFENWGNPCFEHNILIAIIKTSLFGEYDFSKNASYIRQPATILFWTNVILIIISIIAMIVVCIKKSKQFDSVLKIFFGLIYITVLGSFIQFCFKFPHTCTMDFRYIVPTLFIGSMSIGMLINILENYKSKISNIIRFMIYVVTLFFVVYGIFTYYLLAIASTTLNNK